VRRSAAFGTLTLVRPLRVYLLILVLGAMLPGALLTGILVWRAYWDTRAFSERRLLEAARVDASALDREFASVIGTLQVLATSPALDRDDFEAFYFEGRRVQTTQPGWFTIMLTSADGRAVVSTRLSQGESLLPVVEPGSLQRLIATRRPTVGVVRPSPRGGPQHLFAIRVPVFRNDRLKYALSATVDVESLQSVVPRQLPTSDEWTRAVLDSEGTIAVRTRGSDGYIGGRVSDDFRARIQRTPEAVSRETTREGHEVYAAFSRGRYGWTTIVVVPRAVLDAPLVDSMTGVSAGGALLIVCGLIAVLFVSRRLSADLAVATAAAEAVAAGLPAPRANAHVTETLTLQHSLNDAASLLQKRASERDEEIRRADAARAEAEAANRTKDRFLAVLGHELRNPLAPALTALEVMKMRDPNVFAREREVLSRQIAHMSRLVDDLLDISRLAQGKIQLHRQRFELREAIDRAVDMAAPLLTQRRHTIEVSAPATGLAIDGDIDRVVQVLSNLLTNAARYTPPGGHVSLSASAADDHAEIVCEDDGPGIPPSLAPTLFDTFAQGPRALDRREGGLGLGLALARTFVELHDGTIRVETPPSHHGARFIVTLPLASSSAAGEDVAAAPINGATHTQRILVVDDNADARDMLQIALQHAGHEVATAGDGQDAIAAAARFDPAVGVLDIGLPGMSGYELARHLRASHPGIRLIALTGYGQAWDLEAAAAAGFDTHLAKPIMTNVLLDRIEGVERRDV
jgi:signal transduction histidine kinase